MKHSLLPLHRVWVAACALALGGCASSPPSPAPGAAAAKKPAGAAAAADATDKKGGAGSAVFANQIPGAGSRLRVVQLDVYQLVVPLGAISRSEEFWKHVDEQGIDVGTYDLLRKNGWRVGLAPAAEYAYFRDIIDAYPASSKPSAISTGPAGGTGALELSMKTGVPYQNVWWFTDTNRLKGQTFEECDDLLAITLQQVPRKPGEARVTVCPTVRALRHKFEVTNTGKGREIRYFRPERLYDLNLQVDVPLGHFLVIAPSSPEVKRKTSLGATFLVQDGTAEQLENVMLMVPRAADLEEAAPPAAAAAPAPTR